MPAKKPSPAAQWATRRKAETLRFELIRRGIKKAYAIGVFPRYELKGEKGTITAKSRRHSDWEELRRVLKKMGYKLEKKGSHEKNPISGRMIDQTYFEITDANGKPVAGKNLETILNAINPLEEPKKN